MLTNSDTNIEKILSLFTNKDIEVSFLVPTETGLQKSIIDAIHPFRQYLKKNNIHDYSEQSQGAHNKRLIDAQFIFANKTIKTTASLYRPKTKKGDPRIWFYSLKKYAKPNNLLTLIAYNKKIYIINASDPRILSTMNIKGSPLYKLISNVSKRKGAISNELLDKMYDICKEGFIPSDIKGDRAVGLQLEELLGIKPNTDKEGDYKGIELKARRILRNTGRTNLFSQVPDWKRSALSGSAEILKKYGYIKKNRLQLYCTVSAKSPNPQKLFLTVDEENEILYSKSKSKQNSIEEDVALWQAQVLKNRLIEKHNETFWVKAAIKKEKGKEFFHYTEVLHTKSPIVSNIEHLLANGLITVDFTLSQTSSGGCTDHGYLFKLNPNSFDLLFPPGVKYDLAKER